MAWIIYEYLVFFCLSFLAVNFVRIGGGITFLSALVLFALRFYYLRRFFIQPSWLNWIFLGMGITLIVSFLKNPPADEHLPSVVMLVTGILLYFCVVHLVSFKHNALPWLVLLHVGGAVLFAIYGITIWPVQDPRWEIINPNIMASFLAPCAVLVFLIPSHHRWLWRLVAFVSLVLLMLGLAQTESIGAILALVSASALFIIMLVIWPRSKVGAAALLAGMALSMIPIENYVSEINTMHYLVRKGIWGNTLVVIHDYPVFGIGIDQFQGLVEPRYPIYYYNVVMEQVHTHQLYLQMLTDFGIPGGSIFILLFLSVFWIGVQNIRLSRTRTSILLLFAYTIILLHGLVDIPLLYSRGGFLLWTIMGCIVGHYNCLKQVESQKPDAEPAAQ